jgi:hypothetical protein
MGILDDMNAAFEEMRVEEEAALTTAPPPLPHVPVDTSLDSDISQAAPWRSGAAPNIPDPEGFLEHASQAFWSPMDLGRMFHGIGWPRNPFSLAAEAGETVGAWVREGFLHEKEEDDLIAEGGDARQKALTPTQARAVRRLQAPMVNLSSMNTLSPEFVSGTLNGLLAAEFNKIEEEKGSDKRYAPSQFQAALHTKSGEILFTHPETGTPTPIDSYAITSEDFTHIMEEMIPIVWEIGYGAVGTTTGAALGLAVSPQNPAVAARLGTIMGGLGEALGAVHGKYQQRVSALRAAGYRPVRWNKEENREDPSAPTRWMFFNPGGQGEERQEPYPDSRKKAFLDTDLFLEGAPMTAGMALAGQMGAKALYGLYRLSRRGSASKELGDIATAKEFDEAISHRNNQISQGEAIKQELNTPQTFFNYADHLGRQAVDANFKGQTRLAKELRDKELYYRTIGEGYSAKLDQLGGAANVQAKADMVGVGEVRDVTGIDPGIVMPGSKAGKALDVQLPDVGRRVTEEVADAERRAVETNIETVRGGMNELMDRLLQFGKEWRGASEAPAPGTSLGAYEAGLFPTQSPYLKLQEAFNTTKDLLAGGEKSFFSTQIFKKAEDNLGALVGNTGITIKAPNIFKYRRAGLAKARIAPNRDLSDFIKRVSIDINLPQPERITRKGAKDIVRWKKPGEGAGYYKPDEIEVTANIKDVSSMIRDIRQLKSKPDIVNSPDDMRLASDMERALFDLRKKLIYASPAYREANDMGQKQIRKALGGLQEADHLYKEYMDLYSKGRIGAAMLQANKVPEGPTNQRATTFFDTLIPKNTSPKDIGDLLTSLRRSDIGLRTADGIAAEDLLRSGLYQTYINKVVLGGQDALDSALSDKGLTDAALKDVFDFKAHRKFMSDYENVFKALTPARGNETTEQIVQRLNNEPADLFKVVRDNLRATKKLQKALEKSETLKGLGIDPTRPEIAVSNVLKKAPENYRALRELVAGLQIDKGVQKSLLKDMDDSVKSMFVNNITEYHPGRGLVINPGKLQEALLKVRQRGEEAVRYRTALEVVYSKGELERMDKIAQGLEILDYHVTHNPGGKWPSLDGSILDGRKPFGMMAKVYVGVLNTRARALTGVQRVLGHKAQTVLLEALTKPDVAREIMKTAIPKAGFVGRSILNLVGSITGTRLSDDELDEVEKIAKLEPGDIARERLGGEKPYIDRRKDVNYRDLRTPMKIPELVVPGQDVVEQIPLVGSMLAPFVGKEPQTLTVPPAAQQGLGKLQQKGVDWLRDVEQRKLAGIPAPMNKGGIVNARPRRQIVL